MKGLNRENAVKNEILRLEYDPEYGDFSYIYKIKSKDLNTISNILINMNSNRN